MATLRARLMRHTSAAPKVSVATNRTLDELSEQFMRHARVSAPRSGTEAPPRCATVPPRPKPRSGTEGTTGSMGKKAPATAAQTQAASAAAVARTRTKAATALLRTTAPVRRRRVQHSWRPSPGVGRMAARAMEVAMREMQQEELDDEARRGVQLVDSVTERMDTLRVA